MAQLHILLAQSIATERQAGVAREAEYRRFAGERGNTPTGVERHLGIHTRLNGWLHHGTHVPATR